MPEPMSILHRIISLAQTAPEQIALVQGKTVLTRRQFLDRIAATAAQLESRGLGAGDRVMVRAGNSAGFIITYFAVHAAGGICLPLAPDAPADFLDHVRKTTRPVMEIEDPDAWISDQPTAAELAPPAPDTPADIMFTSGTTGRPKGVVLTHGQLAAAAEHIIAHTGNTDADRELLLMPLAHSFGLGRMRSALYAGTRLVLGVPLVRLKSLFKTLEAQKITGLGLVPAAWEYLSRLSGDRLAQYRDQLNYMEFGSAPLSAETKSQLCDLFPSTRLVMHYGLTEVSRAVFTRFHDDPLDTAGSARTGAEIRILDAQGNVLPPGEEGEIALKADWMLQGYYKDEDLDGRAMRDGFLRTGDLGYIRDDHLVFKGRRDEMINVAGKKVDPAQVEAAVNQHPAIAESACVGCPDPHAGQVVQIFAVAADGELPSAEELRHWLGHTLPGHMKPRVVTPIDQLPKTSAGKLQRLKLAPKEE